VSPFHKESPVIAAIVATIAVFAAVAVCYVPPMGG